MTQPNPQSDKLEFFKKEVAHLRSLGLLPLKKRVRGDDGRIHDVTEKLTTMAVRAARKLLKSMSETDAAKAKRLEDERIQTDRDFWEKVDDDEIWDDI